MRQRHLGAPPKCPRLHRHLRFAPSVSSPPATAPPTVTASSGPSTPCTRLRAQPRAHSSQTPPPPTPIRNHPRLRPHRHRRRRSPTTPPRHPPPHPHRRVHRPHSARRPRRCSLHHHTPHAHGTAARAPRCSRRISARARRSRRCPLPRPRLSHKQQTAQRPRRLGSPPRQGARRPGRCHPRHPRLCQLPQVPGQVSVTPAARHQQRLLPLAPTCHAVHVRPRGHPRQQHARYMAVRPGRRSRRGCRSGGLRLARC